MSGAKFAQYLRSKRSSRWLLLIALATTLVAVMAGQSLMFGLYRTSFQVPRNRAAAPSTGTKPPLVVGIARTPGGPSGWIAYAAAFAQLERDLGRPVLLRYVLNRSDITHIVQDEQVDIALVPIVSYLKLKDHNAATLVAAPVIESQTRDAAVMVVARKSGVQRIEELRGGTLLLSPDSLAGHAFAYWLFERKGWDLSDFFDSLVTSGTQDAHLGMVARGEADATCVNRSDLASWPEGTFRVVAESPGFGTPPLVAREGLARGTIEAIRRSLVSAAGRGVMPTDSVVGGFSTPAESDYGFPRALMRYEAGAASSEQGAPR